MKFAKIYGLQKLPRDDRDIALKGRQKGYNIVIIPYDRLY